MITIFNRREVYITSSLQRQIQIRNMLKDLGIETLIIINSNVRNRGSFDFMLNDRIGEMEAYINEYRIFVHGRDYEKASAVLSNVNICMGEIL